MSEQTRKRLVLAGIGLLGVLALLVGTDIATSSPRLCGSCHEIAPRAESWAHSPHASVGCVKCHEAPTEWYELPQRLVGRARLLGHDVTKHIVDGYSDPVDRRVTATAPVTDANCVQCHDPDRKPTSGLRILIDHGKHARLNGECISCHVRVAHPVETRSDAQSLMAQCYNCHGVGKKATAPGDCNLCHPKGYELLPASHKPAKWKKAHGEIALEDVKLCRMCHEQRFCDQCHGVAMPHPAGWEKRGGHSSVAQLNRAVCGRCHGQRPDMCTMCHHKAYDPSKGTWRRQHPDAVRNDGAAFCIDCHSPVFCANCHVRSSLSWE